MTSLQDHLRWTFITAIVFLLVLALNELIFMHSEFIRGVNWVYLPAGVRLLSTLLFGLAGATGLLIASWIACFYYFFPDDVIRSIAGSILATIAPLAAYFLANEALKMGKNLRNLTSRGLLVCVLLYAAVNASLHYLWVVLSDFRAHSINEFTVMFIGDASGAMLLCYAMKGVLNWAHRSNRETV